LTIIWRRKSWETGSGKAEKPGKMTFKKREAVHKTEAGKGALPVRQGLREDSGKTFFDLLDKKEQREYSTDSRC